MKVVFCIVFFLAQTVLFGQEPGKTKIADSKKEVTAVEVSRVSKTVTVTFGDGTKEELTEKVANDRGYVNNDGYGNFTESRVAQGSPFLRLGPNRDTVRPLLIVNGREFNGVVNEVDPTTIESVSVLKGAAAKAKYGEKGRIGVIEIKLKPSVPAAASSAETWQGKTVFQLLGAIESDQVVGFELSVQDENEDIIVTRQRGAALSEASQKALAKARKGSPVIFEKIRLKRDGKEITLPSAVYKR